jgi:hypothetical protein
MVPNLLQSIDILKLNRFKTIKATFGKGSLVFTANTNISQTLAHLKKRMIIIFEMNKMITFISLAIQNQCLTMCMFAPKDQTLNRSKVNLNKRPMLSGINHSSFDPQKIVGTDNQNSAYILCKSIQNDRIFNKLID